MFLKGLWDQHRAQKWNREQLRKSFGKAGRTEYADGELNGIVRYFEKHPKDFQIDDITWNDLNLDEIFLRMNSTCSSAGQEYLYATYQTEGVIPEFWKNLARENQLDFKASGSAGKCIEGREFIIALPESFVQYRADDVVRLFTETFSIFRLFALCILKILDYFFKMCYT